MDIPDLLARVGLGYKKTPEAEPVPPAAAEEREPRGLSPVLQVEVRLQALHFGPTEVTAESDCALFITLHSLSPRIQEWKRLLP